MNDLEILNTEILSDDWYTLKKITYQYNDLHGKLIVQSREAYDRGNGATILLYNRQTENVILTRQFRMPTFINGNESGMMIECCAGLLDEDNPEDCIRRETEEETGFLVRSVKHVFKAYMSPGSVTEVLHFYIAEYNADMKISEGGGVAEEQEHIEVWEIHFDAAIEMIRTNEIKDAKTIMLLQYAQIHQIFKA